MKAKCLNCGYEFDVPIHYIFPSDNTSNVKEWGYVTCPKCGSPYIDP